MRLPVCDETSVILCNRCGRRISVQGIRFLQVERGEFDVTFFACPHCGADYLINTTDERQRELFRERAAAKGKQAEKLGKEIRERFPELKAIGEKILNGESEVRPLGSEGGGCGPESV